jgi:hypothetical protein
MKNMPASARSRSTVRSASISLIEEWATISLAEFDAEIRFRTQAARGSVQKGLAALDKLDAAFQRKPRAAS